jgi:hypothetical protein
MLGSVRRRVGSALFTMVAAVLTTLAVAPPASAAGYGWVYISTPKWLANCAKGGSVTGLLVSVGDTWSTTAWDRGDDRVYAKVKLGQRQQVSYTAFCNKWPGYYQPGVAQFVRATRNNQTAWIGPAGVRYN